MEEESPAEISSTVAPSFCAVSYTHLFFLFADDYLNRRSRKIVRGANGIFQISFVREMQKPLVVYKQNENGRTDADLGGKIHFHASAEIGRRLVEANGIADEIVERARGNAETGVRVNLLRRGENFFHALSRLCLLYTSAIYCFIAAVFLPTVST